jgi:hypothetical protein
LTVIYSIVNGASLPTNNEDIRGAESLHDLNTLLHRIILIEYISN